MKSNYTVSCTVISINLLKKQYLPGEDAVIVNMKTLVLPLMSNMANVTSYYFKNMNTCWFQ